MNPRIRTITSYTADCFGCANEIQIRQLPPINMTTGAYYCNACGNGYTFGHEAERGLYFQELDTYQIKTLVLLKFFMYVPHKPLYMVHSRTRIVKVGELVNIDSIRTEDEFFYDENLSPNNPFEDSLILSAESRPYHLFRYMDTIIMPSKETCEGTGIPYDNDKHEVKTQCLDFQNLRLLFSTIR